VLGENGKDLDVGQEGELCISGPGVMQGYWALPEQTERAFFDDGVRRWYKTGDLVIPDYRGQMTYVGRRDRMVKRRGYRIELGEIEAGLYLHAAIAEAAVVAYQDEDAITISAFLSSTAKRPSIIEMKRHCADRLPIYMIPDRFVWLDALPKTSTDKIDYQRLKEMV
jgi:acyl-coenzyme A synthetase/AMP-(fatty) acid ligase